MNLEIEELKSLLKEHGWFLWWKRVYKARFAYARRRSGKSAISRYLIAESKIDSLTSTEVLKRIGVEKC